MAVLIADGQLLSGFLSGFDHQAGICGALGHGLFAHDVLARVQRVDGDFRVRAVGGADVNHVDLRIGQQFLIIGINLCAGHAVFLGGLHRALLDQVAEGNHVRHIHSLNRGHVLAVGDAAAADDTDFQSFLFHENDPSFHLG